MKPVLEFDTTVDFLNPTEEIERSRFAWSTFCFRNQEIIASSCTEKRRFLRERRFLVIPMENPDNT